MVDSEVLNWDVIPWGLPDCFPLLSIDQGGEHFWTGRAIYTICHDTLIGVARSRRPAFLFCFLLPYIYTPPYI
jgi:hypothetical protein